MNQIKTILFDIGGVVTFTNFEALYKNFGKRVGLDSQMIIDYQVKNWSDLILGNIDLGQFFSKLKGSIISDRSVLQTVWIEEMIKVRTVNSDLLNIIPQLRKHYSVGVLSNLTFSRMVADEAMALYDYFDFTVLSCHEHLKKPDPAFYNLALERTGAQAEEAVFIDDKERNTLAAKALGLKDILYSDNEKLVADLKSLGVEVE